MLVYNERDLFIYFSKGAFAAEETPEKKNVLLSLI